MTPPAQRERGDPRQLDRGLGAAGVEEAGELAQRGVAAGERLRPRGQHLDDREPRLVGVLGEMVEQRPQARRRSARPTAPPASTRSPARCRRGGCRAGRRRRRGSSPPCCRRVRRRSCARRRRLRSRRRPWSPGSRARRRPRSSPGGCGCAGIRSPPPAVARDDPWAAARSAWLRVYRKPPKDCRAAVPLRRLRSPTSSPIQITWSRSGPTPTRRIGTPTNSAMKSR